MANVRMYAACSVGEVALDVPIPPQPPTSGKSATPTNVYQGYLGYRCSRDGVHSSAVPGCGRRNTQDRSPRKNRQVIARR